MGAGLAGCAAATVLADRGFHCTVVESKQRAADATSGLPVAVYRPYISIGQSIVNDYFTNAFERLLAELTRADPFIYKQCGLLQLIPDTDKWQSGKHWSVESNAAASGIANKQVKNAALYIEQAGALSPAGLCAQWLQSSRRIELTTDSTIATIHRANEGWAIIDSDNKTIATSQLVIFANGHRVNNLVKQTQFPLTPISGQISHFKTRHNPQRTDPILAAKGYVIPSLTGYWAGATHQRNSSRQSISAVDDQSNLDTLNSLIPDAEPASTADMSWAGIRCASPDRLPLVGGIPDTTFYQSAYQDLHHGRKNQHFPPGRSLPGLFMLTGFGSRGATQALYAAECLADIITGVTTTDPSILSAIHPARFLMRELRKRPTGT